MNCHLNREGNGLSPIVLTPGPATESSAGWHETHLIGTFTEREKERELFYDTAARRKLSVKMPLGLDGLEQAAQ